VQHIDSMVLFGFHRCMKYCSEATMIFTAIRVRGVYADSLYGTAYAASEQVCSTREIFSRAPIPIRTCGRVGFPLPKARAALLHSIRISTQTRVALAVRAEPCQPPKPTKIAATH